MQHQEQSRVWIFQADRLLTEVEISDIQQQLDQFVANWFTHGRALTARASIQYAVELVIEVNQAVLSASGCSIDKMTHFIQDIGKVHNVDFFNRQNVAILRNGTVALYHFQDIQTMIERDQLDPEQDLLIDALVENGADLKYNWLKPIAHSWLNRFITV